MNELVKLTRRDDIAVITIDNPPVNALSPGVPEGITACIRAANEDAQIRAIVLIGADNPIKDVIFKRPELKDMQNTSMLYVFSL